MVSKQQKVIAKMLTERTVEQMKEVADRYGLTSGGLIDVRGHRLRFNHTDVDLRLFLLEGCDLSDSEFTNCIGEGVSFSRCILKRVRINADRGKKISFRRASFDEAVLNEVTMGPRTLDLSGTTYRQATLRNVTFIVAKLHEADFTNAKLEDVLFRSGELNGSGFRGAKLTRVSFEKATLDKVDFTDATFEEMEKWGEPNFEGAVISDALRYRYGIVREPLRKIDSLIARGDLNQRLLDTLRQLRNRHGEFLANPEVMLIASEYEDEIPADVFTEMLKALKAEEVH